MLMVHGVVVCRHPDTGLYYTTKLPLAGTQQSALYNDFVEWGVKHAMNADDKVKHAKAKKYLQGCGQHDLLLLLLLLALWHRPGQGQQQMRPHLIDGTLLCLQPQHPRQQAVRQRGGQAEGQAVLDGQARVPISNTAQQQGTIPGQGRELEVAA